MTFFIPNTKDIVLGPDTFFPNARDPTFFDRRYAAAKIMATFEKEMKGLKLVKLKNEYSQASNGYSRRDILQAVLDQPDMEDATDDDKQTGWAAWKKRVVDGKSEEKANEETNSSSEIEQKQAFGIGLFGGMIPINDTTSMKSSTSDLSVEGLQKLAQGQMSIDELVFAIDHDADLKSYQKVLGSILAKTPEKSIIYPDLCTAVDKLNNYVSLIDKFSSYEKKVSSKELTEDDLTMYDLLLFALSKSKKNPELLCQVFIDFWAEVEIITEFPVAVVIDGANWFDSPTASDHPFVRRCIHARELSMVNALSRFLDKGPKNGLSILGLSAELDKNLSSTWVNRKSTNSLKATVSRMSSDECIAMVKYLIHLKALPKNRYEKDPQFMIQEAMAMTGKKFQEVHRLISYF